jgi:hypothetical protein
MAAIGLGEASQNMFSTKQSGFKTVFREGTVPGGFEITSGLLWISL